MAGGKVVADTLSIEKALVSKSFPDFLDHVRVLEPPPGGGLIPFAKWDHLMELVELLGVERLLSVLKSRQIGLSWLLAAYALWKALYHEGAVVMLFSQGEDEAKVLLSKVKVVHEALPSHLQGNISSDSTQAIIFGSMKSKIVAYPSTEKAGRGETATLVIQDEADYHDYLDANFAAVKPTIDAGGQLIQISTANKKRLTSLFKELFRDAWYRQSNGYKALFYGWKVRPGRDQKWYDRVQREAPTTADISAELYMEQEYPGSVEEALSPARALSFFDVDALKAMEIDTKNPVETEGLRKIYQRPKIGGRYAAGTDTSHGIGSDESVTVVVDVVTGYVVADIQGANISPEELASESVKLLARYENPIWGIEDNDWGVLTIRHAEDLEYPNIYQRNLNSAGRVRAGWHTDNHSRPILWGELGEAVRNGQVIVPNKAGLEQFFSVIRNPDNGGRVEAMQGAHDDYPMAVGIAWQMRKEAWTADRVIPMRNRIREAEESDLPEVLRGKGWTRAGAARW